MKKIRLNVDDLEVHSFATGTGEPPRGTVHGLYSNFEYSCREACFQQTHEFETCYETGQTCGATCDWGCDTHAVCPPDWSAMNRC